MLWCETAGSNAKDVEDLAVLACQLRSAGVEVGISSDSAASASMPRNAQYDLAPFLVDGAAQQGDRLLLVEAHRLDETAIVRLRRLAGEVPLAALAYGDFTQPQAAFSVRAKLAYTLGAEPEIAGQHADASDPSALALPLFGVHRGGGPSLRPRVLLIEPDLQDDAEARALVALTLQRSIDVAVLTDGATKRSWQKRMGFGVPVYHYGENQPVWLAERAEFFACFVDPDKNYRLWCLLANAARAGSVCMDATLGHVVHQKGLPSVPAPPSVATLREFLLGEMLPGQARIGRDIRIGLQNGRFSSEPWVLRFGQKERANATIPERSDQHRSRIVFMPTNGVGLGHAQRCAMLAKEIDAARHQAVFAAFPSCVGLCRRAGFETMPLVARSTAHAEEHANDLVNFGRIRSLSENAEAFVFDGGYVFSSVYRTILENRLRAVWMRRGLWQPTQDNSISLDREKVFERVIVPSEAFDELNAHYSRGDHVFEVGPIVRQVKLTSEQRETLRQRLRERFEVDFQRLIVTQLGAGVAASRSAQVQAICGLTDRRDDTLNLVLVWPNARLHSSWFHWGRSRVVRTYNAPVLAAAADVSVSAAGYNSFHEAMYNAVPSLFVPQTGDFMDDQAARAGAAAERGFARVVDASRVASLEAELGKLLDGDDVSSIRAALMAATLPADGVRMAAQVIEELCDGDDVGRASSVEHLSARRGRP